MARGSPRTLTDPTVNVLMYHSIAHGPGPTAIPLPVFAEQMSVLARSGCAIVTLGQVAAWMRGEGSIPERAVAITFDDGFTDFIPAARVLQHHGFAATVFLPTGRLGGPEDWSGIGRVPRQLMSWDDVRSLAEDGIEFGGHSVTHPDLTRLDPEELEREVSGSGSDIDARLGRWPTAFAAPYGASNAAVRSAIARCYRLATGTTFARADRRGDPFDIPRIEMYYFRNLDRWRRHLDGRGEPYFRARKLLRGVKRLVGRIEAR